MRAAPVMPAAPALPTLLMPKSLPMVRAVRASRELPARLGSAGAEAEAEAAAAAERAVLQTEAEVSGEADEPAMPPGRSAALTVAPPARSVWPYRRRAIIAVVAAALASFVGVAIIRGSGPAKRAGRPAVAAVMGAPVKAEVQVQAEPKAPAPSLSAAGAPPCASPPPSPSVTVRVVSHPSAATVLVDGVRVGRTPIDLVLARSAEGAKIKLRRGGYRSEVLAVVLDRDTELHVTMQPKPSSGTPPPPSKLDGNAPSPSPPPSKLDGNAPASPKPELDAALSPPPDSGAL